MLAKKSFILIGSIAIITILILFTGCTGQQWRMDDKYPLGENDFLLFEDRGIETFRISKSGYAESTGFSTGIYRYKSGTLSEEEMMKLSEYIKESGFFRLRGTYISIFDLLYGHYVDYYGMSIKGEDEIKTVYVYNPGLPDPFSDVWEYLCKEVEPKLQDEIRYGTYIMARMRGFSRSGVVINDVIIEDVINVISEEDLKAHPFLEQAIDSLGWFVYIGSLDDTRLGDYITPGKDYFYINYKDKEFFIGIYELTE